MELVADRYELREPIGSGGMADVVEAHDRLLERSVAVKLLREHVAADPTARARFLQEARTAARFSHPNAVAVFDSGADEDTPWIVMELVDGENLAQRLAREGALDEAEVVRIGCCVLAALDAAHRQGIVHRDIKPDNIMLLPDGSVKLADFGIAKSLQEAGAGLTVSGQITGTPQYLSPEQVEGEPASPASDVYAAGVVLYEMLTGAAPFTGDDPIAVAVAHTRQTVPDLQTARPDASEAVTVVVARALEKHPWDRYGDAGEMRRALGAAGRGEAAAVPAGTTAVLAGGTTTVLGEASSKLRRVWRLGTAGAVLLAAAAVLALVALGQPDEPAGPEPARAGTVVEEPDSREAQPQEVEPDAGDAVAPADGGAKKAKDSKESKGNGKGKGKGRGKKD